MAKASPASNVGAPHWNGYGTRILQTQNTCWILPHKFQVTRLWLNSKLSVNNKLISQGCNRVLHKKVLHIQNYNQKVITRLNQSQSILRFFTFKTRMWNFTKSTKRGSHQIATNPKGTNHKNLVYLNRKS